MPQFCRRSERRSHGSCPPPRASGYASSSGRRTGRRRVRRRADRVLCLRPCRATLGASQRSCAMRRTAVNDVVGRFKWVGTRPIRPDGVPKVTGRALYAADYTMAGALIGKILRSPHAHARIRSIDTAKAAALPGVKAVVTAKDFPDQKFEYVGPERVAVNFWHVTRNVMAREKALYEGHAIAAVAAIDAATADEALALIEVDYEVLPHA